MINKTIQPKSTKINSSDEETRQLDQPPLGEEIPLGVIAKSRASNALKREYIKYNFLVRLHD